MSLLNFFGGAANEFGSAYYGAKQDKIKREDDIKKRQYDILGQAFSHAADEGNNENAASILEMMIPLTGEVKKGQTHPLDFMVKAIRGSQGQVVNQVTPEAQTMQQSQLGMTEGSPEALNATRPTRAIQPKTIQKGYFSSPEERRGREIAMKVEERKQLLPLEMQEEENKQKLMGKRQQEVESLKAKARLELSKSLEDSRVIRPTEQDAYRYSQAYGVDIDTAREAVGQLWHRKQQAQVADVESKTENRKAQFELAERKLESQIGHWQAIEDHFKVLESQGNRKLDQNDIRIQQTYGQAKPILERAKGLREQMRGIVQQQLRERSIMTNVLNTSEDKAAAGQRFQQLEQQYNQGMAMLDDLMGQLQGITPDVKSINTQTSTQSVQPSQSKKSIGKKPSNDPLGIR